MPNTFLSTDIPFTGEPDATLPYAGDYDTLETYGSLALLEPAHSASPFVGVPNAGDMLQNILWRQLSDARVANAQAAATAVNSGFTRVATTLGAGGADVANRLITERSTKGGLHGIYSQTTNVTSNVALVLLGGSDLKSYLDSVYATHKFYVSMWDCVTKVQIGAGSGPSEGSIYNTNTANMLYYMYETSIGGTLSASKQDPTAPGAATGNRFRAAGINGPTGTASSNNVIPFAVGPYGPFHNTGANGYNNKAGSRILYRWYLEDLTLSGRSYADVVDMDYKLWQKAMASGGRYNGDTFTAPVI